MKNPLVSIVVPAYNTAKYLPKCLESLIAQTFSDIEIIIIDDASTDDTLETAQNFAEDDRIKIIHHHKNLGANRSRLDGVKNAKGKYCLFIDSDDWTENNMVKNVIAAIKLRPETDVVRFHGVCESGELKNPFPKHIKPLSEIPRKQQIELLADTYCLNNVVFGAYKRETLLNAGCFKENTSYSEDYSTNIRLVLQNKNLKMIFIDKILYHCSNRPSSTTRSKEKAIVMRNLDDQIVAFNNLLNLCEGDLKLCESAAFKIFLSARNVLFTLFSCADIKRTEFIAIAVQYLERDVFQRVRLSVERSDFKHAIRTKGLKNRVKYSAALLGMYDRKYESLWKNVWYYKIRRTS